MADKQAEEQRLNPETAPDPDEDDLSDLDGDDCPPKQQLARLTDLFRHAG